MQRRIEAETIQRLPGFIFAALVVLAGAALTESLPKLPQDLIAAGWQAWLIWVVAFLLGTIVLVSLFWLARLQSRPAISVKRYLIRFVQNGALFCTTLVAGSYWAQAAGSVAATLSFDPASLFWPCLLVSFFGATQALSRMRGLYEVGGVRRGELTFDSFEKHLPAEYMPDVLVIALSRRAEGPPLRDGAFAAALSAIRDLPENSNDVFDCFLAKLDTVTMTHPWAHSVRSLSRHFGSPAPSSKRKPEVHVLLSALPGPPDHADVEWEGDATHLGFCELIDTLMQVRFGDGNYTQILGNKRVDMYSYSAVEKAVRTVIVDNARATPLMRQRIVVDVTAGLKTYSLAAGAATLDTMASVSYIDTAPPYALRFRRLLPLR